MYTDADDIGQREDRKGSKLYEKLRNSRSTVYDIARYYAAYKGFSSFEVLQELRISHVPFMARVL